MQKILEILEVGICSFIPPPLYFPPKYARITENAFAFGRG